MKTIIRIAAALGLLVSLLAVVLPAAAGAEKTPISGVLSIRGAEPLPEYHEWWSTDQNFHFRGLLTFWYQDANDPRMDGYSKSVVNVNYKYDDEGLLVLGHVWGEAIMYTDATYSTPTWECTYSGHFDASGKAINQVCKGLGEFEGLVANMRYFCPSLLYSIYDIDGVLIEPGGK